MPLGSRAKMIIARGKVQGVPNKAIAREAGCSEAAVQHCRTDREIVAYIAELAAKCKPKLDKAFENAVSALVEDVQHEDPAVRSQARADLIDYLVKIDKARGVTGLGTANLPAKGSMRGGSGEYELMQLQAAWVRIGEEV